MEHAQVVVDQIQPRFARALRQSGADAHDVGIGTVAVIADINPCRRRGIRHPVPEVARLAFGAFAVEVD